MRWRFARRLVRCWPACRRELRDLRGAVPRPGEPDRHAVRAGGAWRRAAPGNPQPARLAHLADWAKTLPPRPLARTVTPVPGEYHLDCTVQLAEANYLEFGELTGALDDPAAILHHPHGWRQHEQERFAAADSQPPARIARPCWPDPHHYLRSPDGFHRMLRPACRRCTARRGITEPIACHLPHRTVCRRHRLWIGPSDQSPGTYHPATGQVKGKAPG